MHKNKYIPSGDAGYICPEELLAHHLGKDVHLNQMMLDEQGVAGNKEVIAGLLHTHVERMRIISIASELSPSDSDKLKLLAKRLTDVFVVQQELWGFEVNSDFHEFWIMPHCTCGRGRNVSQWHNLLAKTNAGESYKPVYTMSPTCPIHGGDELPALNSTKLEDVDHD